MDSLMQGRALLNAIGNLELTGAYAEALSKLGLALEDVAAQVWPQCHLIHNTDFMILWLSQLAS